MSIIISFHFLFTNQYISSRSIWVWKELFTYTSRPTLCLPKMDSHLHPSSHRHSQLNYYLLIRYPHTNLPSTSICLSNSSTYVNHQHRNSQFYSTTRKTGIGKTGGTRWNITCSLNRYRNFGEVKNGSTISVDFGGCHEDIRKTNNVNVLLYSFQGQVLTISRTGILFYSP